MSYTEFKALLKKINLKPKGVKEIVLEVSDGALHGKIDMLSEMLDGRVAIAIDSEIVRYNVQINARTEKPIRTYRVDEQGVVSEVQPQGEQLEMDLGVAKKPDPVADIPEEISREVVDEFILSGLAPQPKGFYPLAAWIGRIADGDTYLKIAGEEGIASGRVVDLIDEYRQSVAPLAAKWDEWRQTKGEQQEPEENDDADADDEPTGDGGADQEDQEHAPPDDPEDDIEMEDGDPDYSGKEVVITQNYDGFRKELIEIVFPIIDGEATLPSFYIDKRFDRVLDEREVLNRIGVAPIPSQDGEVRYLVNELLGFGGELRDIDQAEGSHNSEDDLTDWEQEATGASEAAKLDETAEPVDVEAIILTEKPAFEDIPFDFPALLARKKSGETWMEIAQSIGTRSTVLSTAWTKYKKRVEESRGGAA